MTNAQALKPAHVLATHDRRFPNDSDDYRKARLALLAEEIELRRHIERVAAQRRSLPPGGVVVPQDYRFQGVDGPVSFADLFGDKSTLVTYNWMYGTERERPCPMCTSLLSALALEHAIKLFRLVGGGDFEAASKGFIEKPPRARLAILPATSHTGIMTQARLIADLATPFLEDETPPMPPGFLPEGTTAQANQGTTSKPLQKDPKP